MLLEESLQLSRELEDAQGTAFALNNLGLVALRSKDFGRAQSMLSESLARFWGLRDQRNGAEVLEGFAELAIAEGKPIRGAQLLAAATTLRAAIGAVRSAYEQQQCQATLAAIRSELDEPAFTRAATAGESMSLEEAVKYALGEAE